VFTVDSDTAITVTVPESATTGLIAVTTPGGIATSVDVFTVYQLPTITSFTPTNGNVGITVTITGTNLTGTTEVIFNGLAAAAYTVDSDTSITVTVPDEATSGKIMVTTPGGTATSATDFYVAPTITSFAPTSGKVGDIITITGTNLTGATAVDINGTNVPTFTVVSINLLTATVPSGADTGKISVTTAGGTATSATDFTVYQLPTITSFTPTNGNVGITVTITGTNLTGTTEVIFNGLAAAAYTVDSDTSITVTVPDEATSGKIMVTTPGGTATSATDFYVAPTITSFAPTSGKVGDIITITGTNLTGATAVDINGTNVPTFTVVSNTSLTVTVPSGATTGKIAVTTAGGTATSVVNFTVYQPTSLEVTIDPGSGYIGILNGISPNYNLSGPQPYAGALTLNNSGKSLISGLRPGTYDLTISGSHWLRRIIRGINVHGANTVVTALTNGDADGGNSIDLFDYVVLDSKFGSADTMADLDGDGAVTLFDYTIIDQNFGAQGDNIDGSTNSVVSVLTFAGEDVIPVPDGTYAITVRPSMKVFVTIGHEELPATPHASDLVNTFAYTCPAGISTTINLDTLNYNSMRITGATGTKTYVGFNGPTIPATTHVLAGCYPTPVKTGSVGYADGIYENAPYANSTRIRQDGTITKVRFWNTLVGGAEEIVVRIWRKVGTTWQLVGQTENLVSKLTPSNDAMNTVVLSQPIYGVKQGDWIAMRSITKGSTRGVMTYSTITGATQTYVTYGKWNDGGIIWTGATSSAQPALCQVFMEAPNMVGIGDSLMEGVKSGSNAGAAFIKLNGNEAVVPIPRNSVMGYASEKLGSRTFQNMGWGGEKSNFTDDRFAADCVALAPKYAVILVGVNDIGLNPQTVTRRARSATNVATLTIVGHQLRTGQVVTIAGMTDSTFNAANVTVTGVTADTFTYANTGSEVADGVSAAGKMTVDAPLAAAIVNWNSMLTKATAALIKPVIILPLPWTIGSNEQLKTLDSLRASLISMATTYDALVVDARDTLGVAREHFHIDTYRRTHVDKAVSTYKRVGSGAAAVATIVTTTAHGLNTGDRVVITSMATGGIGDSSFSTADAIVTVVDTTTFTYVSYGPPLSQVTASGGQVEYAVASASCAGNNLAIGNTITVTNMVDSTFNIASTKVTGIGTTFCWNSFGSDIGSTADVSRVGTITSTDAMPTGNRWNLSATADSGDGLHLSFAGNQLLGGLVATAIKSYEEAL
ncbi:MAG: beta strand repeat-containing protein, partial [Armatimonadota bacterium]